MNILGAIGAALLEFVLPTLATAIAGLVVGVLTRFLKKQKIDVTDAQEKRLKQIVEDAIKAVEEAARRDVASGLPAPTSERKAQMAREIIVDRTAAEPGVSIPDPAKLNLALDAALPGMRKQFDAVPGVGRGGHR